MPNDSQMTQIEIIVKAIAETYKKEIFDIIPEICRSCSKVEENDRVSLDTDLIVKEIPRIVKQKNRPDKDAPVGRLAGLTKAAP